MKKLLSLFVVILGFTVLAPSAAEAGGHRTRVTYDHCGSAIHWEYRCAGHDYHGCPIYRWVVVRRCAPHGHFGHHGGGYRRGIHIHAGFGGGHRGGRHWR